MLPIGSTDFILRDKGELVADGLPDQQTIKGIFMLKPRKVMKRGCILCGKWQEFKTGLADQVRKGIRCYSL